VIATAATNDNTASVLEGIAMVTASYRTRQVFSSTSYCVSF
jgi:hypothetical protein